MLIVYNNILFLFVPFTFISTWHVWDDIERWKNIFIYTGTSILISSYSIHNISFPLPIYLNVFMNIWEILILDEDIYVSIKYIYQTYKFHFYFLCLTSHRVFISLPKSFRRNKETFKHATCLNIRKRFWAKPD